MYGNSLVANVNQVVWLLKLGAWSMALLNRHTIKN